MNVEPYFSRPPKNWQVLAWQLELQNSAGSLHCQTVFFFKLSLQNENDDELGTVLVKYQLYKIKLCCFTVVVTNL